MVDLQTLQKPLREWETEEVSTFLKDLITADEEERLVHNKLSGSRMKDFCCFDFLVHIVRLSEFSAAKVLNVLRPYLDEMESTETEAVPHPEYQFSSRIPFGDCDEVMTAMFLSTESMSTAAEDMHMVVDDVVQTSDGVHLRTALLRELSNDNDAMDTTGDDYRYMDNPNPDRTDDKGDQETVCSTQNETTMCSLRYSAESSRI